MMVLHVCLKVSLQTIDPLRQQRDLNLGRAGVLLVGAVLLNQTGLYCNVQRHRAISLNVNEFKPKLNLSTKRAREYTGILTSVNQPSREMSKGGSNTAK